MNVEAAEEAHDDTVDQAVDEAVGEAVEQAVDQPRKRPRAPTAGSVDEEVRPRRSQRETRPTSRVRRS